MVEDMKHMKIAVIGLGYAGIVNEVLLTQHNEIAVDLCTRKMCILQRT